MLCPKLAGHQSLELHDLPSPPMLAGGVRIAIRAAGVNFADSLITLGRYQDKPQPPFIPGFEAAGEVLEVGGNILHCKPGDRVLAMLDNGGFAEEAVAQGTDVHVIPDEMDFETAAAFPIAYGTSWLALRHRAHLQAGETLLVLGAAGGVGLTAIEIGKALGATVIAAASGAEKLALAGEHGADHLIDLRAEDIRARVKALTNGRGADVVYDPVGGDGFHDDVLRSAAQNGRILILGFAAGGVPEIPANYLLVKNIAAIGINFTGWRRLSPDILRLGMAELFDWWRAGQLRPHVSARFPLAQAPQAIDMLLTRKARGKVVLVG